MTKILGIALSGRGETTQAFQRADRDFAQPDRTRRRGDQSSIRRSCALRSYRLVGHRAWGGSATC